MKLLIPSIIKNYLSYEPETGNFIWFKSYSDNVIIGSEGGHLEKGYRIISFKYKRYKAHRIAWYLYYGKNPKGIIDHINGIKDDNRICNLRDTTSRVNNQNNKRHRKGCLVGASWHIRRQKWQSRIHINNESMYLGLYDTELEAHNMYMKILKTYKGR